MIQQYQLNYGWPQLFAGDPEEVVLTLRAQITGAAAMAAVSRWFSTLTPSELPSEAGWRYHGGASMFLHEPTGAEAILDIESQGQDAADSVAWYAQEVVEVVQGTTQDTSEVATVTWTELPPRSGSDR
ncbi:hypothetical protein KEM60_01701 [Austwickia sp. TVS 96-490-7B]|uniref:hypothetical protein n=1 Tax=Austwickia sp. TVS 96-490-7B TaxID=2830843 RepID=UPI001C58CE2E|nr:hypothetical protein [Austwickia sp. TVS 96-490-7B]MBW3085501.1 hypothetical protein [Austwickia sp. TVS 96-490-7B]